MNNQLFFQNDYSFFTALENFKGTLGINLFQKMKYSIIIDGDAVGWLVIFGYVFGGEMPFTVFSTAYGCPKDGYVN